MVPKILKVVPGTWFKGSRIFLTLALSSSHRSKKSVHPKRCFVKRRCSVKNNIRTKKIVSLKTMFGKTNIHDPPKFFGKMFKIILLRKSLKILICSKMLVERKIDNLGGTFFSGQQKHLLIFTWKLWF